MTYETIQHVLDYVNDQQCAVQITYDPSYGTGWTADFKSETHATVCAEELRSDGFEITGTKTPHLSRLQ